LAGRLAGFGQSVLWTHEMRGPRSGDIRSADPDDVTPRSYIVATRLG
jgi:hypothetical protein